MGEIFLHQQNIEKITERFTSQFSTSKTSLEIHPLLLSTINLYFRKCNTYVSICTYLKNSKLYLSLMIPKSFSFLCIIYTFGHTAISVFSLSHSFHVCSSSVHDSLNTPEKIRINPSQWQNYFSIYTNFLHSI